MDLLRQGSDWLERTRKRFAASRVQYQRAAAGACVSATVGRATYAATDAEGFQVEVQSWDFLITAADLELDGELTEPAAGDRIVAGDTADAPVYEVMPVAGGPCWQWSDPHRRTYRVHTKHVGRQPPQPR